MNTETTPAPKEVAADDRESLLRELAQEIGPRQTSAVTVRCRSCGFAWDVGAPAHHNADCLHLRAKRYLAASGAPQEAPGDAPQLWKVEHDLYTQHTGGKPPVKLKVRSIVLAKNADEAEAMGAKLATAQVFGPRIVISEFRSASSQGESFVISAAMKGPQ